MKLDKSKQISQFVPRIVDLPYGDKSITHRALICAALSDGKCKISNPAINADTLATINCLRTLGATINILDGNTIEVFPISSPINDVCLDCQNSGTTARLLAGVVAGLGVHAVFVGDASLTARPMRRIITPLTKMGVDIREKKDCLFEIFPSKDLKAIEYTTPIPSAQVKSAILFAGLFASGKTIVREKVATRNHTEIFLRQFGAEVQYGNGFAELTAKYPLKATDVDIPNDFSTAAFLIAMNLQNGIILKNVGINPTRIAFLKWLEEFGAQVKITDKNQLCGEDVGTIIAKGTSFKPVITISERSAEMIDEIPICCILSAMAKGESEFYGINELSVKESDRLAEIKKILKNSNVEIKEIPNGLIVCGNGSFSTNYCPDTHDHRIAMLGVLTGVLSGKYIPPKNSDCIDVSCPNFFQLLGFPFEWGLFGINVKNSLSPIIYDLLSEITGIESNYHLYNVEEKDFQCNFSERFSTLNGANLTMPYKTNFTSFSNPINTLKRIDKNILTFNTDGWGILYALNKYKIDVKNKNLLILGCGGAGVEAVRILSELGANIVVRNRTISKVQELAKIYPIKESFDGDIYGILSFLPQLDKLCLLSDEEILKAKFIFDSCYLTETPIIKIAKKYNKTIIDGRIMLWGQGIKNFEIWTGKTLSLAEISRAEMMFWEETNK